MKKFRNPEVKAVFDDFPDDIKLKLLDLRQYIFDTASKTPAIGKIEECLRWNDPTYLTSQTKSGSMIRINKKKENHKYAMYFHCHTSLVDSFKEIHGDIFLYEGNRSIVFDVHDTLPVLALKHCIKEALTYHLNKKI